jgi:hypothetical protein
MTLIEIAELLGNFGEFFGAILVGASLCYLAVQIRHNAKSTEEANMRAEVERFSSFGQFAAGTPGFMEIFLKAQKGETITHVEWAMYSTHMFTMLSEFRLEYQLHQRRPGANPNYAAHERLNMGYLSKSGGRTWWEGQKGDLFGEGDFVQYVDELLSAHDHLQKMVTVRSTHPSHSRPLSTQAVSKLGGVKLETKKHA